VHISVGQVLGLPSSPAAPVNQPATTPAPRVSAADPQRPAGMPHKEPVPSAPRAPSITTTALAGQFAKDPYDGTPKTHYPCVAVTVIDWSRSDCWTAVATLWRSGTKSEAIPAFSVCPNKSLGFALNNAAKLHLVMEQSPRDHTGNVRTKGPKQPMIAIPDTYPMAGGARQNAFNEFIQQLAVDTAWGPGAPTNIWIVGFDKSLAVIEGMPTVADGKALDPSVKLKLERALSCLTIGRDFGDIEPALTSMGWRRDITPIPLPSLVNVFGMPARSVAVARDGGEQTYSTYFDAASLKDVVKAASLKLGKDDKSYGRVTKLGVLTATQRKADVELTCTVDTEG
jgi:hypothetical protein